MTKPHVLSRRDESAAATRNVVSGTRSARSDWGRYVAGVVLLAVLLLLVANNQYWLNIIVLGLIFAGLAAAWNIIGGFGGQMSLGHGVYFAIGAYSVAILFADHGLTPWFGIVISIPIAVAVAAVTSWPTFRLRGPFFAMATLALNQVALVLANFFASLTGGPRGISLPFVDSAADLTFADHWKYGAVALAFVAIAVAASLIISRSRLGFHLRAVREDPEAAAAAGVSVLGTKMWGMLVSAAITAVGGGLYAVYIGFIDPDSVLSLPDVGVRIALLALLGGIGTVWGPVIGALILLPAITQLQASLSGSRPGIDLAAVGLLLVLIPILLRRGLIGTATQVFRAARRRATR